MFRSAIDDIVSALQDPEFAKEYGAEMAKLSFSNTLFNARSVTKITQQELADNLGLSQPYIARLESGEANPTLSVMGRILATLGFRISTDTAPLIPTNDIPLQLQGSVSVMSVATADPLDNAWGIIWERNPQSASNTEISGGKYATVA